MERMPEAFDQECPANSGRLRNRRKRPCNNWLVCALIILSLIYIKLLVALFVVIYVDKSEVCLSPQCLRSASMFISSMNKSADPCDNFYNFVCGRWNREHPLGQPNVKNTWFMDRMNLLQRDIVDYLEERDKDGEPSIVTKARLLYRACVDFDSMEENWKDAMAEIMDQIGFDLSPPLLQRPQQPLFRSIVKAQKVLNLDILIGFIRHVTETENTFIIHPPYDRSLLSDRATEMVRLEEKTESETKYRQLQLKVTAFIYEFVQAVEDDPEIYLEDIKKTVSKVVDMWANLEVKLARHQKRLHVPEKTTISNLQFELNKASQGRKSKLQLKDYLKAVLEESGSDKTEVNMNSTIYIINGPYFMALSKALDNYRPSQLESWIWWKIIYSLAPHINMKFAEVRKSLDQFVMQSPSESRQSFCSKYVLNAAPNADHYFTMRKPHSKNIKYKVQEMLLRIKAAIVQLISNLDWMDSTTKENMLRKLTSMSGLISYPDKMTPTDVEDPFHNMTFYESGHLYNLIQILLHHSSDQFIVPENEEDLVRSHHSLDINAYYGHMTNTIHIPGRILQFPFYDLGLEALNYGAIGSIIGHEVTHGMDSAGSMLFFNGDQSRELTWTNASLLEYSKRVQCYIEEFNRFYIPSTDMHVDGALTIRENVADLGGVMAAFYAYRSYSDQFLGSDLRLPGFETYSQEQLLLMSFAQTWCDEYSEEGLKSALKDVHSPGVARINVALRNMKEFSEAWNCPAGSPMNSDRNCRVWTN